MEKLGVQKQDLLNELRSQYSELRQRESSLVKTGAADPALAQQIEAVKARIDELEAG